MVFGVVVWVDGLLGIFFGVGLQLFIFPFCIYLGVYLWHVYLWAAIYFWSIVSGI